MNLIKKKAGLSSERHRQASPGEGHDTLARNSLQVLNLRLLGLRFLITFRYQDHPTLPQVALTAATVSPELAIFP